MIPSGFKDIYSPLSSRTWIALNYTIPSDFNSLDSFKNRLIALTMIHWSYHRKFYSSFRMSCNGQGTARCTTKRGFANTTQIQEFKAQFRLENIPQLPVVFSRSSGPGGQNVNKVNTKVMMRIKLKEQSWLPVLIQNLIREKYKQSINHHDEWIITSDTYRTQLQNLNHCKQKVYDLIQEACWTPTFDQGKSLRIQGLYSLFI